MKAKVAAPLLGLLSLLGLAGCLPIVLLITAIPSSGACRTVPAEASLDAILATIRRLESGGDYTARASGSSASGAYQFLDSSWNSYGGFARAYLAPPQVQDAKAVENVTAILAANADDPAAVPVAWYVGHVPAPGSARWDTVPAPGAGNRLTPREYQAKWMDEYRQQLARESASTVEPESDPGRPRVASGSCAVGVLLVSGNYALPVERRWYDEHPEWFSQPHHDYPAADIPVPTGTPIYAAAPGTVASTTAGGSCGIGAVINGDDGATYTYCHGLPGSPAVTTGENVTVGQLLMRSASTGNSTAPHLHFAIKVDGQARCPQPFLAAIADGHPVSPASLPVSGCTS
jgi:murein DD-endopeptidase MepM/ murein hydrolase activator NlpD